MLRNLTWLLLLTPSSSAFARPKDSAQFANKAFHEVLVNCPERLWPKLNYLSVQMLFVSEESERAWRVHLPSSQLETVPFKSLEEEAHTDFFNIYNSHGNKTIAVNVDADSGEDPKEAFGTATHELFHELVQKNWGLGQVLAGDLYPFQSEPRYLRMKLLEALKAYARTGDLNALKEAKAWYSTWQATAPAEIALATDLTEGTAVYVEALSTILGTLGCDASQVQIDQAIQTWIESRDVKMQSLQTEGYDLGAIAGFLLDRQGRDWKDLIQLGRSPLDLLLNPIVASPQPEVDKKTKDNLEYEYSVETADASYWIETFENQLKQTDMVRVGLPKSWQQESVSFNGDFIPTANPTWHYTIYAMDQEFLSPSPSQPHDLVQFEAPVMSLNLPSGQSPCANTQAFILVPKSKLHLSKGRGRVQIDGLKFQAQGQIKIQGNKSYFCTGH